MKKAILLFNRRIDKESIENLQTVIKDLLRVDKIQIEILMASKGGEIIYLTEFEQFLQKIETTDIRVINIDSLDSSGLILFLLFPFEKRFHVHGAQFLFHSVFYGGKPEEEDINKTLELNNWQAGIVTTNSKFPETDVFRIINTKEEKRLTESEVNDYQISQLISSFPITKRLITI